MHLIKIDLVSNSFYYRLNLSIGVCFGGQKLLVNPTPYNLYIKALKFSFLIRLITTHWISGQSENTMLYRMMSSSAKCVFFNLKPRKQIALHQIMLFIASSYDPFNQCGTYAQYLQNK